MSQAKAKDIDALTDVVRRSANALSDGALATLVAHPAAVSSALAAAASALKVGLDETRDDDASFARERSRFLDEDEATKRLDARTRVADETDLLTSDEVAKLAGLRSRQTVHDWLRKDRVVGWRGAKRGVVLPRAQFDARGRPTEGLDRVLPLFPDGYAAWRWLTAFSPALDGTRPLDMLREGQADAVVAAATGDAQGDFA